jgi:hypothetical protein
MAGVRSLVGSSQPVLEGPPIFLPSPESLCLARSPRSYHGSRPFFVDSTDSLLCLAAILGAMRFEQFSIVLGALLLGVVLGGLAVSLELTNVLITPPEEGPDWIAKLIAGTIALVCLAAASYLGLGEWKVVKHRRARANEERRP